MPPSRGWPNWSTSAAGQVVAGRDVALRDDDDREVLAARVPALDQVAALLDRDRQLGDQDRVGAAGDARVHGDPARVPSHDLDDHHAVVALGGRVQAVDRLGHDRDGGVEAERVVGRREVVVDRLRHADDRRALLGVQPGRDAERVLAADRDQPVEPLEVVADAIEPAVDLVRVRARGAQDRAAAREDPGDRPARRAAGRRPRSCRASRAAPRRRRSRGRASAA